MAARRQEAYRLEALREVLRRREEECNKENDRHDIETLRGEPPKDRAKEVTTINTNTETHNNDGTEGQHKKKRRLLNTTDNMGTFHHGVTKESEGQQRGRDLEDTASGANSNKEAEAVIGDNVNTTIGKTHNRTDIGDDGEEGQERQEGGGGKDIQAGEELEEGHHGANSNVPTNDPHHSTHGAPSEGQDEGEQKRQVVDGGKDIQAREELEEGHHGTNVPTGEEGEGDKQGTRARGGGGGGDGEMKGSPP